MKQNYNQEQQITNVLITGNTKFFDETTIRQVAQYYKVLISGEAPELLNNKKNIHIYNEKASSEKFAKLCFSFSPDVVWYFSGYSDAEAGFEDEVHIVDSLMRNCSLSDVNKVIMVSSVESLNYVDSTSSEMGSRAFTSEKALCCWQNEEHIKYLAEKYGINLILLRTPYITRTRNDNNYLGSILNKAKDGEKIVIGYDKTQSIDFISMRNLVELMVSISEESFEKSGDYTLYSGYGYNYENLAEELGKLLPDVKFEYGDEYSLLDDELLKQSGTRLRKNYGFVFTDNLFDNLEEYYNRLLNSEKKKKGLLSKFLNAVGKKSGNVLKYIELIILFFLIQYLLRFTSDYVYFKYVDLRLFFVVIMAIAHGMGIGLLAGILECISLIFGFNNGGVDGIMLFYNMDYWIPFIIYLLSGSVIGYIKNSGDQKAAFMEEENTVIREKYTFLNSVYQQVVDNKSEYKRQILGYRDSFGKIFEAVEQLNGSVPADIFMNGVGVLERILDNHSIAIYTVDKYQKYARLVACSRQVNRKLTMSMKLDENMKLYTTIARGETWKNTDMNADVPMYAYGINKNSLVQIIIAVYDADINQMGLYYLNLFSILCSLIRVSFLRAYDLQHAIENEKYYEGTVILKAEYFDELLNVHNKMKEAEIASFALLKLRSNDIQYVNDTIVGMIRNNDVIGTRDDGAIYLMLTQLSGDNLEVVGKRLKDKGLLFDVVGE